MSPTSPARQRQAQPHSARPCGRPSIESSQDGEHKFQRSQPICIAPQAESVCVIGDFNQWREAAHPLTRRPDGVWSVAIPMHHGHHRYLFVVDGEKQIDPKGQGVTRNERNERVSLISVS